VAEPTAYRTMTEIAATTIKDGILTGIHPPGTRLIPTKLEQELQLGRVSIREALKELAGMGLVNFLPNRGAVVAKPMSIEEIQEVFEVRYDLEPKAAYRATQRISETDLTRLEVINKSLPDMAKNPHGYVRANHRFHRELYKASGWGFVCRMINLIYDQVMVFRLLYPPPMEKIDKYIEDHRQMLSAMKARDADAVRHLMFNHLVDGFENVKNLLNPKEPSDTSAV
jgi:DNA-binding GntR family transcriptional regulator